MIDSELQSQAAKKMAQDSIEVPDEESVMVLGEDDESKDDEFDLESLMKIREEAGVEGLTEEEYAYLQAMERKATDSGKHYANLAESLDENELNKLAIDVLNWVRWDEDSRSEWYEREKHGIRALGVSPNVDGGAAFSGASKVVHPLIAEAVVQFQSRSLDQMWPAGGPCKTKIKGKITPERAKQSKRVEQFLNFQYTELMAGAFEQTDKMLLRLPISGSVFMKTYFDPIQGICREMVEPADLIVPYRSTSLRTTPRFTERIRKYPNDVKKMQVAGVYRDITLMRPFEEGGSSDREEIAEEIAVTEGRERVSQDADDQRHTLYECYCELDLPGFEHKHPETNEPTGIALPYLVTVDRDSLKVLAVYRNWRKKDPRKERIIYYTHYRYMPGLGFYGYGLPHWIGGLGDSATGALRALMDSAQFANMSGGFRSKDAALPNGKLQLAPGDWQEIDTDLDDLKKAFFPLPYKEPSATLFNLLGTLDNLGRRFASTTEAMVGEGNQNTPVGTMLARIEQGSKIYTAIQKRCHEAAKEEFKLVGWLNSVWMPEEYPYEVEGEERAILKSDFDSRIDVIPVSDPNSVSNTQRYFMAQAVFEMAKESPQLYNMRNVHMRVLTSLKIENVEELLPDKDKAKRYDPVTENALAGIGRAIHAHMEQDHQSHNLVHQMALQSLPPDDPAAGALNAHIREHTAMTYLLQMSQATGVVFRIPDEDGDENEAEDIPLEAENQLAMASAQAAQQMMEEQQANAQAAEQEQAAAEQAPANLKIKAEIARKDDVAAADIRRDDMESAARINREQQQHAAAPNKAGKSW